MSGNADALVADAIRHCQSARWAEAEDACRAALVERPDHPDALHVFGIVAWRTGRQGDAVVRITAALKIAPGNAEAWKNLGIVLYQLNRRDEALAALKQATELQPNLAEAHYHIATALRERGAPDEAIASYRRVLAVAPGHTDTLNDLGALLKERGRLPEAIATLRQAIDRRPEDASIQINLAGALMDLGDTAAARAAYRRALILAPERPEARFGFCLSQIPISYEADEEIKRTRAAYTAELHALHSYYAAAPQEALAAAAPGAAEILPFYLAYQGEDDRKLQELFGDTLTRIMTARYPQWAERPAMPPLGPSGVIRVGFVTSFFRRHSVWKLFAGWIEHLDRRGFQTHGYSFGRERDAETDRARAACAHFVEDAPSFESLAERIRADDLHVLIYPEIGMDAVTEKLAALRLAPVQCMSWGHPVTSGLPTVDYFLTSDLMEPEDGQSAYREKLVRLPNLSIHYTALDDEARPPDLNALGVRTDAVIYLCCQSLYKYLPRNDDIFPRIAAAVPAAQFVFLTHRWAHEVTAQARRRLHDAFAAAGLDAARHVVFVPSLGPKEYAGLNQAAHVYLDSLEWSGGNTTLEAIAAGLPVVTLPGRFMRGRHSAAMLQRMGVLDTIARDKDDYVTIAARLGSDLSARQSAAQRIRETRSRLYNDLEAVRGLESFIAGLVAAG